ncbi:MAG: Lrp/AsnC family transcriptional regulator [Candidatus Thorarchaeota archaeon]
MAEKSSNPETIDGTDIEILKIVQKKGRATVSEISKKVGKGISTVHARMKRLLETGFIERYTANLNPRKLGRGTLAFILVTVTYRVPGGNEVISQRRFCREIAEHRLVQSVHVLSGEYDVLLKVRARDIDEMNRFIVDFLRKKPAVDKTLTMFAMDTYLDTLELRGLKSAVEV